MKAPGYPLVRRARFLGLIGALAAACSAPARAAEGIPTGAPPPAAAPLPAAATAAPPGPERLVSPEVAAELAAAIPPYNPPRPGAAAPAADSPAVVRMPAYLVRSPKLPTPDEVLTPEGRADLAMDRYLGSVDGLDRGVLNHVTLVQLWRKIPVLGQVPFVPFGSITNEARALELSDQDRRLQEKADLLDLVRLMKKTGDAAGGAELKRAVDDTFK
jgi:hypothetical protein